MTGQSIPPAGITVVVTGAGAPVGVSILKALRLSRLCPRIVATDVDSESVGLFRADVARILPPAAEDPPRYRRELAAVCRDEGAAMVFFGSEAEMRTVAPVAREIEHRSGARLIVNHPRLVDGFLDKWTSMRLLRSLGLPVPETILTSDLASRRPFLRAQGYPVVLKPRHGSGSKNFFVLHSDAELERLVPQVPDGVIQEYLYPDDEEYTVGVYRSRTRGYIGQIQLKRVLASGLTYKAEVVRDTEITAVCRQMVERADCWGPVNLQLRKTVHGVKIFEVNLRLSSSAVMRAYFGFNEPEMCLRDEICGEHLLQPEIRMGRALRYWDEIYIDASERPDGSQAAGSARVASRKLDVF